MSYKFNPFTGNLDYSEKITGLTTSITSTESDGINQYNFINGILTSKANLSYYVIDQSNNLIASETGDLLIYEG